MTSGERAQKLHTDDEQISHVARPIKNTANIWVVTRDHYGINGARPSEVIYRGN